MENLSLINFAPIVEAKQNESGQYLPRVSNEACAFRSFEEWCAAETEFQKFFVQHPLSSFKSKRDLNNALSEICFTCLQISDYVNLK